MKKPHILAEVFRQTTSCAANRQIAHNLQVAADTIDRAIGRLGRHCLLMHSRIWGQLPPSGPIAIDGLEISNYTDPILTTLCQPMEEMGTRSVEILVDMIQGSSGHRHELLPTKLRQGASVRRLT